MALPSKSEDPYLVYSRSPSSSDIILYNLKDRKTKETLEKQHSYPINQMEMSKCGHFLVTFFQQGIFIKVEFLFFFFSFFSFYSFYFQFCFLFDLFRSDN